MKNRTKEDTSGPMSEENIEEAVERIRAIGSGKQKGYFAIVSMEQMPDGLACTCMSKVTNSNTHDILRTFYSTMGITAKDRGMYDALDGLEDEISN